MTTFRVSYDKRTGPPYQAYGKAGGCTRERAAERFEERHGYAPAEVKDGLTVWLAGPIEVERSGEAAGGLGEPPAVSPEPWTDQGEQLRLF